MLPYMIFTFNMKKTKTLLSFVIVSLFFTACGNDENVQAKFVGEMNKAIKQLTESKTVDDIVVANEIQAKAYEIEGVDQLSETGPVEEVMKKFDQELDSAQKRVLDNLKQEFVENSNVQSDSVK